MSDGEGGAGLRRLSHTIGTAKQLTRNERGRGLDEGRADEIAAYLRAALNLVRGRERVRVELVPPTAPPPIVQRGTRRYKLWERSPLCLWCGRVTRIEGVHEPDAATLDHLRRKDDRARPSSLPDTVLACRECNNERGQPPPPPNPMCPLLRARAT